jgi:molybdopterin-guanine dinucleotide biosynthesis protein A
MGQDKALLLSGSDPLVTDVAQHVAVAAGSVALVGHPERYSRLGLDCIVDLRPNLGPISGIESALVSRRGDLNLIVACDMPGLTVGLLQRLLQHAAQTGALCVVGRDKTGTIHPLCAVYHSNCLPVVQGALDCRRLRLMDLVDELRATPLDVEEMIWNVNTPQEWSAWREQQFSVKQLSSEGAPIALTDGH